MTVLLNSNILPPKWNETWSPRLVLSVGGGFVSLENGLNGALAAALAIPLTDPRLRLGSWFTCGSHLWFTCFMHFSSFFHHFLMTYMTLWAMVEEVQSLQTQGENVHCLVLHGHFEDFLVGQSLGGTHGHRLDWLDLCPTGNSIEKTTSSGTDKHSLERIPGWISRFQSKMLNPSGYQWTSSDQSIHEDNSKSCDCFFCGCSGSFVSFRWTDSDRPWALGLRAPRTSTLKRHVLCPVVDYLNHALCLTIWDFQNYMKFVRHQVFLWSQNQPTVDEMSDASSACISKASQRCCLHIDMCLSTYYNLYVYI